MHLAFIESSIAVLHQVKKRETQASKLHLTDIHSALAVIADRQADLSCLLERSWNPDTGTLTR